MRLTSIDDDLVIKSKFLTGFADYNYAINKLYPMIDKLSIQRNLQDPSFYKRLRHDLMDGCIMPPITIAIIVPKEEFPKTLDEAKVFLNNKEKGLFILDGIQRLNALKNAYTNPETDRKLDLNRPIFLNIIICPSMDNLLYRMITLNNGQKPMSANHQIEILLGNVYEFNDLGIELVTEKEKGNKTKKRGMTFDKSNIIKGYLAFVTNSVSIDNKKIIDEKMDTLITKKILDSDLTEGSLEFSDVISLINRLSHNPQNKTWFDNTNNLIGFCVGIRDSFEEIKDIDENDFNKATNTLEYSFKSLNVSTIKLSKERRSFAKYFIAKFNELKNLDDIELLEKINDEF